MQAAVTKAQADLPVIESALAAIPGRIAALNAERMALLAKAEASPV